MILKKKSYLAYIIPKSATPDLNGTARRLHQADDLIHCHGCQAGVSPPDISQRYIYITHNWRLFITFQSDSFIALHVRKYTDFESD